MPAESTGCLVLDLTLGSGGLTVACAKAGYCSIAYEQDQDQAIASAHVLQKFFNSSKISLATTDPEAGTFAQEEDEDDEGSEEDMAHPKVLQKKFKDAIQNADYDEYLEESVGY